MHGDFITVMNDHTSQVHENEHDY